ncbi:MAG: DUF3137 domain-containing protein [Planctomycetota bacterium]|jgi:hypothetical protein
MKTYDEFKTFYSEELLNRLLELDAIRKGILVKSSVITVVILALAAIVTHFFLIKDIEDIDVTMYFWAASGAVWFAAIYLFTRNYRSDFKQMVIRPLVDFIDPNLQYTPEGMIDIHTFRRAEIFQRYVNEFDGEDLISGTIGKTIIRFSEVKAYYCEENEDSLMSSIFKSKDSTGSLLDQYKHKVFKGLFFAADFHKTFHGQVLVMPDRAEKYFGRFGSMLQSHNIIRGELMKMDNAEFEHHFVVYGSDQIQTRYVLTPAIMDRILDFKKKTGDSIYLSFKNSKLYIAVPCRRNLFEPKYFKSMVDYIETFRYFQDLRLFISIVDEFNLNTRIWTKE